MAQDIVRVYQECDPAMPLDPGSDRYVVCDDVRGVGDLVAQLANAIQRSKEPTHMLFTGHRGSGKSTELRRLEYKLSNPPADTERLFVVYFEADKEDVDVNDVDFPDLLLAIVRQTGERLRTGAHIELKSKGFDRLIDGLKNVWQLLGSAKLENLQLDVKISKITATIKSSPNVRRQIREALEPSISNLIDAANELLVEAVTELKKKGYDDLVIIVDNLDRIVLRDLSDGQCTTHERLFINRGTQLTQFDCHVVYTLPVSMLFSANGPALKATFSQRCFMLPMIKVINKEGIYNPAGIEKMRDIMRKRFRAANVATDDAFDSPETLDYLCCMSGGHPRNFLMLFRSACDYLENLPVTRQFVEEAVRGVRADFDRALRQPAIFTLLRKIDELHTLPEDPEVEMLLNTLSVLEYINGDPFFAVNPIVRELDKFRA